MKSKDKKYVIIYYSRLIISSFFLALIISHIALYNVVKECFHLKTLPTLFLLAAGSSILASIVFSLLLKFYNQLSTSRFVLVLLFLALIIMDFIFTILNFKNFFDNHPVWWIFLMTLWWSGLLSTLRKTITSKKLQMIKKSPRKERKNADKNEISNNNKKKGEQIKNFFKKYKISLQLITISFLISLLLTGLYALFHVYVKFKLVHNDDIFYAYRHIDIQNWSWSAGLFVGALTFLVWFFYLKILYDDKKDNDIKLALAAYL